jgi:hypothetical protein
LREQNPHLPAVLFMNEEEKELFLEKVNLQFRSRLERTVQRRSRSAKAVRFGEGVERVFDPDECVLVASSDWD